MSSATAPSRAATPPGSPDAVSDSADARSGWAGQAVSRGASSIATTMPADIQSCSNSPDLATPASWPSSVTSKSQRWRRTGRIECRQGRQIPCGRPRGRNSPVPLARRSVHLARRVFRFRRAARSIKADQTCQCRSARGSTAPFPGGSRRGPKPRSAGHPARRMRRPARARSTRSSTNGSLQSQPLSTTSAMRPT